MQPMTTDATDTFPPNARRCISAPMESLQPSRIRNSVTNGLANSRYGMRRPQRVRVRSLFVLTIGLIMKFRAAGMLPTTSPISQFGAWWLLMNSGRSEGISISIRVKQKSPQSIQIKRLTNPNIE